VSHFGTPPGGNLDLIDRVAVVPRVLARAYVLGVRVKSVQVTFDSTILGCHDATEAGRLADDLGLTEMQLIPGLWSGRSTTIHAPVQACV